MNLRHALLLLEKSGYSARKKTMPVIVCADMGTGKTTFIEKINSRNPGSGYDLEVADIPDIWDEPDEAGNMALVNGWENMALDCIKELDGVDYVATTSDKKLVKLLIAENIPFFLVYKDNVDAVREAIEKRTRTHFRNVVTDFRDYIEESDIPESLKEKMLACDESALYDYRCTEAIPEDIINTEDFQNDDRYRHWHDMFRLRRAGGRSLSIMEQNIEELEKRLKFYDSISDDICHKIPLDENEFLSSPAVMDEITAGLD